MTKRSFQEDSAAKSDPAPSGRDAGKSPAPAAGGRTAGLDTDIRCEEAADKLRALLATMDWDGEDEYRAHRKAADDAGTWLASYDRMQGGEVPQS